MKEDNMKQGWEIKKIKDICYKESSNIAQNKIVELDGDYPVYGASGFIQNVDFYQRDTNYIGVVKDGSGVGRVNIYPAFSSLLGTLQYILPKDGFHINYVAYALKSLNLSKYASGAAIPHIYFKDYGEEVIPVPPLPVQEQIVSELDLLSGIIEKKREQLKELDALAQSIFYDMFGDPITNEKGWEVRKLKNITSKIGSGATPKGGNESYKTEGISLIRSLNVHNNSFVYKDLAYIDDNQAETLKNVTIEENDVLLNITGASVARCCVVPSNVLPARVNQHVAIIRAREILNNTFLCYLLTSHSYQQELISIGKCNGATREAITKGQLENLDIPIPPLPLQHQFASKIEAIERQKELIKQSISETETLFNARMQEHFG